MRGHPHEKAVEAPKGLGTALVLGSPKGSGAPRNAPGVRDEPRESSSSTPFSGRGRGGFASIDRGYAFGRFGRAKPPQVRVPQQGLKGGMVHGCDDGGGTEEGGCYGRVRANRGEPSYAARHGPAGAGGW